MSRRGLALLTVLWVITLLGLSGSTWGGEPGAGPNWKKPGTGWT